MANSVLFLIEKPSIKKNRKYQELAKYFPHYVIELKHTAVTLYLLWEEYKKQQLGTESSVNKREQQYIQRDIKPD